MVTRQVPLHYCEDVVAAIYRLCKVHEETGGSPLSNEEIARRASIECNREITTINLSTFFLYYGRSKKDFVADIGWRKKNNVALAFTLSKKQERMYGLLPKLQQKLKEVKTEKEDALLTEAQLLDFADALMRPRPVRIETALSHCGLERLHAREVQQHIVTTYGSYIKFMENFGPRVHQRRKTLTGAS